MPDQLSLFDDPPNGYEDVPDAEFLYSVCMGSIREKHGVITCDDFCFLEFPAKRGGEYECLTFGCNAIAVWGFANDLICFCWMSVASVVVKFPASSWASVKDRLTREADDRNFWKLRCSRSSAAKALRAYIRRRDGYLSEGLGVDHG